METLEISREWDDPATTVENRRLVTKTVNIFKTNKVTREKVLDHYSTPSFSGMRKMEFAGIIVLISSMIISLRKVRSLMYGSVIPKETV